ncbi:unnamed protein product [Meganyctiphanes norvegica]|uniref:Uncharacterized protein n=1 Tax=Meganyctiphanes norvegica TaxID=48144 RepID=A0AAV2QXS6_MEGNR
MSPINVLEFISGSSQTHLLDYNDCIIALPWTQDVDAIDHLAARGRLLYSGWPFGFKITYSPTVQIILTCGIQSSFGVVFGVPLSEMGASSTTVGWIFNLYCMMWNLGGLLVGPLTTEFGWRPTAMVSAITVAVSMIISGFATTPFFLFFSFSIVTGLGCGLCVAISLTFGAQYFKRYLGVANAFPMAGVCLGGIILPQLVRILQEEFAYLGSMLVLGAIILNSVAATLLFHPPQWHWKKLQTPQDNIESNEYNKHRDVDDVSLTNSTEHVYISRQILKVNPDMRGSYSSLSPVKEENIGDDKDECPLASQEDLARRDRYESQKLATENPIKPLENENKVLNVIKSILSNLLILRSPRAIIIAVGSMFFIMVLNFIIMVPFAFLAAGHTIEDGARAASIGAIANLVARFSISMMSDLPWFSKRHFYTGALLVCSFGIAGFTFTESLLWQTVFTGIYGFGMGANFCLYSLVMVEYMGLENLGATYGAVSLTVTLGYGTIGPLIGFVRDFTGSFDIAMLMTAACPCVSFILWLFMPAAVRHDQKKEHKDKLIQATQSMIHVKGEGRRASLIF